MAIKSKYSSDLGGERWYVVHTLARMEATAEAQLDRQGFTSFFPRILSTRRHARKVETVRTLLFPRYGFVCLDLDRDRWRAVGGTIGVASLVMGRERPQPVPHGIVEALLDSTSSEGVTMFHQGLKPGDPVRMVAGPFSGELGILDRLDERGRVELLLSFVNGIVRLRAGLEMLSPVA